MAALLEARGPEILQLSHLGARDLEPLLEEEIRAWRSRLDWDFQVSADLVRRFIDMKALSGFALLVGSEVAGYCYFVCEERKGLMGDLFVREAFRNPESELRLLYAGVESMTRTPSVRRIESQLMLYRPASTRDLPAAPYLHAYPRNLMVIEAHQAVSLTARPLRAPVLMDVWTEAHQDDAAQLIASAYRRHVDSEINDQYCSTGGARRFLFNIIQYPGCGTFFEAGSWVAVHRASGRLCGASLTSMVAPDVGHVTQICVSPNLQGTGVGYELLRRSLMSLVRAGCRRISLTVTASNTKALELYQSVGFRIAAQFPALVWHGW